MPTETYWPYYGERVFVFAGLDPVNVVEELGRVVWFDMGVGCPSPECGDFGCNGVYGLDAIMVSLPGDREIRVLPNHIRRPSLLEILAIDE
jgi:hypothetical protein